VHPAACVAEGADRPHRLVGPLAVVVERSGVGPRSRVGALSFVGAWAVLGEDVRLYPEVVVREGVRDRQPVIVHPAVLGADGLATRFDGRAPQDPAGGRACIEDDVEIGANSASIAPRSARRWSGGAPRSTTWSRSVTTATSART
jgi:UDP-3-O-[3-hydroxymyristoyl] glucosamine N-acyltransferase